MLTTDAVAVNWVAPKKNTPQRCTLHNKGLKIIF